MTDRSQLNLVHFSKNGIFSKVITREGDWICNWLKMARMNKEPFRNTGITIARKQKKEKDLDFFNRGIPSQQSFLLSWKTVADLERLWFRFGAVKICIIPTWKSEQSSAGGFDVCQGQYVKIPLEYHFKLLKLDFIRIILWQCPTFSQVTCGLMESLRFRPTAKFK